MDKDGILYLIRNFISAQCFSFSVVQLLCLTLWNPRDCSTPGFTVFHHLLEFVQIQGSIESMMSSISSSALPFSFCLQFFPSIRVFSSESALCIRWPKYGSFSVNPSNEYSGLASFRIDWLDLFVVQGTLKSLLQHHSSKPSILHRSAFFIVQLSHSYMTTAKTIALTSRTFVGKKKSLLFNMLSRVIIAFLPRSKHLLISWLQQPSAVILEPLKIKSVTVSIFSPSISHEFMGLEVMISVFWMLSFKPAFHSTLSLSSRGSLVLCFLP